ncbi:MATE family efflux transporter [Halalkalibacterium halodurans]|uniref:MATE family efflux transporter n=1 Tax=Halalkalibacterium halodurans TaxID=86665 RepID=UPI001067678F|nr:MATE family efflux transporter [Halalkalibacterium halodurans]TES52864.1 MATE family efflux transporter [Halalkalibacterium halodurans]
MEQKQQSERLGTEAIPKLLRSLSIPAMIGMFVMALYNVVDTIFISYAVGIEGVAGVTIAFPIMMIMMSMAGALGIGGASVISRRLGERRGEEANQVFGNILTVILVLSVIGFISAFTLLGPALQLFGATSVTQGYATDYLFPILLGSIFFFFAFAANNIIRSEGNATFAMVTMIVPAVLNILLDVLFIFGLNMGVLGASIATVIAQASVTGLVLRYFLTGKSTLSLHWSDLRMKGSVIKEVCLVGLPAFVQQSSASLMMIAINSMLLRFGSDFYVGVFGLVQRIMMFVMMPMMGIMQAMQPIVGYNYGAKQYSRLRETVMLGFKVATIFSIGIFALLMLFPEALLRVFTADREVIQAGVSAMHILFCVTFLIGAQIVAGGLYQSLGKSKQALILSLSRQIIFLIPLVLILPHIFGLSGVWWAFPIADVLSFILTVVLLYRDRNVFFLKTKEEMELDLVKTASST